MMIGGLQLLELQGWLSPVTKTQQLLFGRWLDKVSLHTITNCFKFVCFSRQYLWPLSRLLFPYQLLHAEISTMILKFFFISIPYAFFIFLVCIRLMVDTASALSLSQPSHVRISKIFITKLFSNIFHFLIVRVNGLSVGA